jgi:sulfate adenylyltransferase subunit 1
VAAKISSIESLLDINTQQRQAATDLKLNGIARINITVQQPLAADAYQQLRATGSFILIDEVTHQTVAAGMIRLD